MRQTQLVGTFEESRTQGGMYREGGVNDLSAHTIWVGDVAVQILCDHCASSASSALSLLFRKFRQSSPILSQYVATEGRGTVRSGGGPVCAAGGRGRSRQAACGSSRSAPRRRDGLPARR